MASATEEKCIDHVRRAGQPQAQDMDRHRRHEPDPDPEMQPSAARAGRPGRYPPASRGWRRSSAMATTPEKPAAM